MRRMFRTQVLLLIAGGVASLAAQERPAPGARLVSAPRLTFPGAVDSNTPILRDLVDGEQRVFAITSFGGTPSLSVGDSLERLPPASAVRFDPHPGHGVWMESVIPAEDGTWYGFYHQEHPAEECHRPIVGRRGSRSA
jgi:hypothetical protein